LTVNASYNASFQYLTSKYPNTAVYNFGCIIFNKKNIPIKLDVCHSFEKNVVWNSFQRVKCVLDLKVNTTDVSSYNWNFLNDKFLSNNKSLIYTPQSDGCKAVVIEIKLFEGIKLSNCFQYFVTSPFPLAPNKTEFYELSNEEENINGANYGRLLALNGNIWLTHDVTTASTSEKNIPHNCPLNFRYKIINKIKLILF